MLQQVGKLGGTKNLILAAHKGESVESSDTRKQFQVRSVTLESRIQNNSQTSGRVSEKQIYSAIAPVNSGHESRGVAYCC